MLLLLPEGLCVLLLSTCRSRQSGWAIRTKRTFATISAGSVFFFFLSFFLQLLTRPQNLFFFSWKKQKSNDIGLAWQIIGDVIELKKNQLVYGYVLCYCVRVCVVWGLGCDYQCDDDKTGHADSKKKKKTFSRWLYFTVKIVRVHRRGFLQNQIFFPTVVVSFVDCIIIKKKTFGLIVQFLVDIIFHLLLPPG